MPLIFVVTAKSALLLGAAIGVAAAVLSNDKVIEFVAESLQKGADRLYARLNHNKQKAKMNAAHHLTMRHSDVGASSEVTTPSHSDDESDQNQNKSERELYSGDERKACLKLTRHGKSSYNDLSVHSLD